MSRITLTLGTEPEARTVYWDVDNNVAAILAQTLVQSLGPADGEI